MDNQACLEPILLTEEVEAATAAEAEIEECNREAEADHEVEAEAEEATPREGEATLTEAACSTKVLLLATLATELLALTLPQDKCHPRLLLNQPPPKCQKALPKLQEILFLV